LSFLLGIFIGFVLVIAIGLDQHFGGLEEARKYLNHQRELYPGKEFAPEFLKKMASNRIYSTLFYPNTLAGALLLFSPLMLLTTLRLGRRWCLGSASRFETSLVLVGITLICILLYLLNSHVGWLFVLLLGLSLIFPVPRWIAPSILTLGILAVLYWSGSKAGWLLMLLLALIAFQSSSFSPAPPKLLNEGGFSSSIWGRLATSRSFKILLVTAVLLVGLTGFFVRHYIFFKKGASSVIARFDYWRTALQITKTHPFFGTGPGTFQIPYEKMKHPEFEMTRLAHNDYLEQLADSGIPAFLLYTGFIVCALFLTRPSSSPLSPRPSPLNPPFLIWLGLLGWAAQCVVEFSLEIPALAWPAFALLGCLQASKCHVNVIGAPNTHSC
jgi:O-antigen ligase